jgi:transcriptional regulator with XRE-family HTH domain
VNGIRIYPQRLLLERCRCGLSQAALARKARLAYLTVSRIERDHATRVRATTAYKLALALEVDIEQLMTPITSPASEARQGGQRTSMAPRILFRPYFVLGTNGGRG